MVVAKEYQPSIMYIDECERTWPAKKKGKKGKKKKKMKASDPHNPARIKKVLANWKKSAKFMLVATPCSAPRLVASDTPARVCNFSATNMWQHSEE